MGKVLIHKLTNEELVEKRQQDFLKLSYEQRFQKAVDLMRVSLLFNLSKSKDKKNKILVKN